MNEKNSTQFLFTKNRSIRGKFFNKFETSKSRKLSFSLKNLPEWRARLEKIFLTEKMY